MRIAHIALHTALAIGTASSVVAAAQAAPGSAQSVARANATADDARADFTSGAYAECLRKISAVLSSRPLKSDSPERYDLLMLRGECMLRLKQRQPAAQAFETAASGMKSRGDLPRAATATALAALVKASPDLKYKPMSGPDAAGIDIVEPGARQRAMEALFEDLRAKAVPDVDRALQEKSLVPIHALLPRMWELYTVEFAAKGNAASTESKLEEVGGRARVLVSEELQRLTTRLEQFNELAGEPTWTSQVIGYRGLHTDERQELQQMANYLVKIQRTVENARRISRILGRTGENWDTLLADCATARDVAEEAYGRRY